MTDSRPLLLLDVDGPLNPWLAPETRRATGYATHRMRPPGWEPPRDPLLVRLNPAHGPALLALGCELVWATTWKDAANTWIGPVLGLPPLPYLDWPDGHHADPSGVHWKTRHLVRSVAGRPFIWVDDEIGRPDRRWVAHHHTGPALLYRVDAAVGLLPEDFDALAAWAARPVPGRAPDES
ncbi:hypothetical protein ABZ840_24700 [Streptomyces sp. NPDC047117]|uniref:hypothetical protein n=1 Tax=unclassified Streptomyces TaxID=2593676 RepID=UPI0033ECD874